jgi:hypothetical protein
MTPSPRDPRFYRYHGTRYKPYAPYAGCGCLLLILLLLVMFMGLLPIPF